MGKFIGVFSLRHRESEIYDISSLSRNPFDQHPLHFPSCLGLSKQPPPHPLGTFTNHGLLLEVTDIRAESFNFSQPVQMLCYRCLIAPNSFFQLFTCCSWLGMEAIAGCLLIGRGGMSPMRRAFNQKHSQ